MRNVVERAMILGQGGPAISVEHLPADLRKGAAGGAVGGTGGDRRHVPQTLADVERLQIEKTLRFHDRSEEHTSELQSHSDLVCRLLLEKKKKQKDRLGR